jgi:hypothetical protein
LPPSNEFQRNHQQFGVIGCLTLAACLASGCGLADYEQKVAEQQRRIDYIDTENRYLGPPIAPPPRAMLGLTETDPNAPPPAPGPDFDIFLRLPNGISPQFDAAPFNGILYRYRNQGSPFTEVLIATTASMSREDFWKEVVAGFGSYDTTTPKKESKERLGRTVEFESLGFTQGPPNQQTTYFVYMYSAQTGGSRPGVVAIIFAIPQSAAGNSEALTAMDMSLKTLAIGSEAKQMRQLYRPPPAPKAR